MSGINRFLSRRDKHSGSKHTKEDLKQHNGPFNGLFIDENAKRKSMDKEEENKVSAIAQRLEQAGITAFKTPDIRYVLQTDFAKGNVDKAYDFIRLLEDAAERLINPYDSKVQMLGAINRQGVTCFLDALLFAMFARLGSFEAMLYKRFDDEPRQRLATLLRLWINMLRAGKLITVDITKQIQLQLANCGWKEASELRQQDASEAFTFITETLALPLLTLKMDIFHTGKEDVSDDHKFIHERLLELALPEDSAEDGHQITLEECLEMFFNNKIEVKRYLDDLQRRNTLNSVHSRTSVSSAKGNATWVEVAEIEEGQPSSPIAQNMTQTPASATTPTRPNQRMRAPSIIKETYVDEKRAMIDGTKEGAGSGHSRVRKEVLMPAWQFFSLIPWYTDKVPSNDAQVVAHFTSTRPILGISLKRYTFTPKGEAVKRKSHVDIPLEIGLPNFIQDDRMAQDGPAFGNFKLSLQSFICHQGNSVNAGHYTSIVRSPDPKGEGEDGWIRFDDLAVDRVTPIDAQQFLKASTEQTPYLLFYQVVPIEGDSGQHLGNSTQNGDQDPPPSYAESTMSHDSKVDSGVSGLVSTSNLPLSQNSSVAEAYRRSFDYPTRFSLERASSEESRRGRPSTERPSSVIFSDTSNQSGPPITVEQADTRSISNRGSFVNDPNTLTASSQGSNVSQSRTGSKSRPASSSGENRLSRSFSRFTGRRSRDKLNNTVAMTAPPSLQAEDPTPPPNGAPPRSLPVNAPQHHPQAESQLQQDQQRALADTSGGSSLTLNTEADKAKDKAKLKKEHKESGKSKANTGHAQLSKAGKKAGGKPERECAVM